MAAVFSLQSSHLTHLRPGSPEEFELGTGFELKEVCPVSNDSAEFGLV